MLKKFVFLFAVMVIAGMVLTACGEDTSDNSEGKAKAESNQSMASDDLAENDKTDEANDDEMVQESEIGTLRIAYKNKDLDENAESGPVKLNVSGIQIGDLEVNEDYLDMFDGKKKVTVITLKMKAENTSDDTIGFYPDQATITTDTGDQADAAMFFSDNVGGDFIGKVHKEGDVMFLVDSPAKDIGKVNLIVDGAHDEGFESVGEKVEMGFVLE
ncbi:hypothetical protein [Virgibacillus oceani]|uniref:DUF4352 domain-containing protein n=1 Tax=Virgibacillus oceani TaxID=1479511 RepID=A0A917HFX6_9BACI|nr:hypothetical protein [Virgibacillus oceani]GGG78384.1 hypothetical protein GCM10011398_24540 [Virgibacillus oceani]